jgi:hypothetical protein
MIGGLLFEMSLRAVDPGRVLIVDRILAAMCSWRLGKRYRQLRRYTLLQTNYDSGLWESRH